MKEIIVGPNDAGQRFDKLLAKYLNQAPKSFIYKMLRKKNIVLNGKKATGNEKLEISDVVKIFLADDTYNKFSQSETVEYPITNLDIIYEDDNIILVNKPVNMLSQKAKSDDVSINEYLIGHLLKNNYITQEDLTHFKPSVCNRLDRNTSGLIAFGKSLTGLQELSLMFKERSMDKYYLAVVKGEIKDEYKIEGYLVKDKKTNKVKVSLESKDNLKEDYIVTEFAPVIGNKKISLIKVKLITGKTHQIRAHLASIDHPLIGDYKYGDRQFNIQYEEKFSFKGQLLHSYQLSFNKQEGSLDYLCGKVFYAKVPDKYRELLIKEFGDSIWEHGILEV